MNGPERGRSPAAWPPRPPRPPRRWRSLLARLLPPTDRSDLLAALDEVFALRVTRSSGWRAGWWYRRQVVEFGARLMIDAVRSRLERDPTIVAPRQFARRHVERKGGMGSLSQDIRYGLRRLIATPVTTMAVVVSLALAIGANSAIFGAINSLLLRPFPFEEPERLVRLYGTRPEEGWTHMSLSYPNVMDLRESPALQDIAAYDVRGYTLTGIERPDRVSVLEAQANLLDLLGIQPTLGRGFLEQEARPGAADRVAMLTYGTWRGRYGGRSDIVGRTLRLNGVEHTIVGVLPEDAGFEGIALWTALRHDETTWHRYSGGLAAIGRLAPGASVERATAEVEAISSRLAEEYPGIHAGWRVYPVPLAESYYGPELRLAMYALMAGVGLLLLIACINVANLLLARAATRRREIAVRAALGAGQRRVGRMLLVESLLLALAGGGIGLLVTVVGMDLLRAVAPENIARIDQIGLDPRVVGFTVAVSILTGLLFGLMPAVEAARTDIAGALKEGGRGGDVGVGGRRAQRALVVAQIALVLVVLTGAGLMTRTLARLLGVDPGFEVEDRIALTVSLTPEYDSPQQVDAYRAEALERLRALPGVRDAAAVSDLPLYGSDNLIDFFIEGVAEGSADRPTTGFNLVSPGYFRAMGIPVLRGRTIQARDRADSPPVAVVSASMAERFWPEGDALGRRIATPSERTSTGTSWRSIVGVVEDVRHSGLREEGRAEMYYPMSQVSWERRMTFVVHGRVEAGRMIETARAALWSVDADQAVFAATTLEEVLVEEAGASRSVAWLLGVFGIVALVLASLGVFGVVANSVAQRRREMGIRAALGARGDRIFRMVLAQGLRPVALGIVIGVLAALYLTRLIRDLLYEIQPLDPVTFITAPVVLVAVGVLAIWLPARRAARLDPVETLRSE